MQALTKISFLQIDVNDKEKYTFIFSLYLVKETGEVDRVGLDYCKANGNYITMSGETLQRLFNPQVVRSTHSSNQYLLHIEPMRSNDFITIVKRKKSHSMYCLTHIDEAKVMAKVQRVTLSGINSPLKPLIIYIKASYSIGKGAPVSWYTKQINSTLAFKTRIHYAYMSGTIMS